MHPVQVSVDQSNPMLQQGTNLGANAYNLGYQTLYNSLDQYRGRSVQKWQNMLNAYMNAINTLFGQYPNLTPDAQAKLVDYFTNVTRAMKEQPVGTDYAVPIPDFDTASPVSKPTNPTGNAPNNSSASPNQPTGSSSSGPTTNTAQPSGTASTGSQANSNQPTGSVLGSPPSNTAQPAGSGTNNPPTTSNQQQGPSPTSAQSTQTTPSQGAGTPSFLKALSDLAGKAWGTAVKTGDRAGTYAANAAGTTGDTLYDWFRTAGKDVSTGIGGIGRAVDQTVSPQQPVEVNVEALKQAGLTSLTPEQLQALMSIQGGQELNADTLNKLLSTPAGNVPITPELAGHLLTLQRELLKRKQPGLFERALQTIATPIQWTGNALGSIADYIGHLGKGALDVILGNATPQQANEELKTQGLGNPPPQK